MDAETFLEEYGDITAKIRRKKKLKEKAKLQAENITSHLTPDKVQSSGSLQKMAEAVEEALELDKEIKELYKLKNKVRKQIEAVLDRIPVRLSDILYEKYLILTPEEDIAAAIDRSGDRVSKLIKEGQEEVQRVLDEEIPTFAEE